MDEIRLDKDASRKSCRAITNNLRPFCGSVIRAKQRGELPTMTSTLLRFILT